jgi:hypothetical protein
LESNHEGKLCWPPIADDLRRLYLDEGLSAAKIAERYGLKYGSPKTAESTILYHLKRNGIARGDRAAHIRKVTEGMVDEWVKRYKDGESLKQIAGDEVNHVTVFNHLKRRGLQLRDRMEAQIKAVSKHEKRGFDGDPCTRAYMIGIGKGDYYATSHGRATRVRLSTTHPAMSKLFKDLFESYGPIYEYPKPTALTGFEWSLDCDLDASFGFMTDSSQPTMEIFEKPDLFMNFLAGFFDAEGSIWYHENSSRGGFQVSISNLDEQLLRRIAATLVSLGFSVAVNFRRQKKSPRITGDVREILWSLEIWRQSDVNRFLRSVPLRHPEKVEKARIAVKLYLATTPEKRSSILAEWCDWKDKIQNDVDEYIEAARLRYAEKENNPNI